MHVRFLSTRDLMFINVYINVFSVQAHCLCFLVTFWHCWPFLFSCTPLVHSGSYTQSACHVYHLCDSLCVVYHDLGMPS